MCNQSNVTAHLFSINSWFVCTTTSEGMKSGICNNSMEKLSKEFKNDSRAGLIFHISSLCYLPPTQQLQVSIAMPLVIAFWRYSVFIQSCDCFPNHGLLLPRIRTGYIQGYSTEMCILASDTVMTHSLGNNCKLQS